jgi:hypothetical protein
MTETNHVSRVNNATAVLWLQLMVYVVLFMVYVVLFPKINVL